MKWYKHDPDAFIAGTAELTLEEVGAYSLILDLLYSRDGHVPGDDRFMSRNLRCRPQTWRRLRDRLIHKGKIWVEQDGTLGAKRVANELQTAFKLMGNMARLGEVSAEKRRQNKDRAPTAPLDTSTTTSTKVTYSLTTSERIQPSAELLAHEAKRRPTPGLLATAPFDSALARPACAPTMPSKGDRLTRPFTRAEVGKPEGWEWEKAKEAAE